ncbi:unnamed protein product [Arctia plantaginis]|uniref:Glucosylceramidase n=1 Tax=Arctia plantaginis TaxID=874455 RepID=A0A8S1AM72_ARCPL|nr:unnamed protein product [Arctia plantaginis]
MNEAKNVICVLLLWSFANTCADKPCAAIQVPNKSVNCVCNATYCDTINRVPPGSNTYVVYTSSESGLRFNKTIKTLQTIRNSESECSAETLVLHPDTKYQTIEGFGGAITDAAGINWRSLPEQVQKHLINSYFSDDGLQYNTIRVPIGGTDFSTHPYAYNEYPLNDTRLTNYTLAYEDLQYKIPMIKAGMTVASTPIQIVATTWSPPPWMKTNNGYSGYNRLKPEYYQTYANYHLKFLEKYKAEGIPVWAITTTNEPTNGLTGLSFINCLGWTANNMGKWIQYFLGPTIRNSEFKDVKILAGDDQRLTIPYWMNLMVLEHPGALKYIDGVAVHYYTDFIAPAALLTELSKFYPNKFILATEGCKGSIWLIEKHVDLGSWDRAKGYILDIITDLNHNVVGWVDWNLCLNAQGGPSWARNYVDSPIIVFAEKGEFIKQPMFYAMGHFSKFVPRGSKRIKVSGSCSWRDSISNVAFITPRNTIVAVLYNNGGNKTVNIKLGDKQAVVEMVASSVTTIELPS